MAEFADSLECAPYAFFEADSKRVFGSARLMAMLHQYWSSKPSTIGRQLSPPSTLSK
jgi:hypothetical protein